MIKSHYDWEDSISRMVEDLCSSMITHCRLMMVATEMVVNTGSGNGLVPDGTKPLPEPMLIIIN